MNTDNKYSKKCTMGFNDLWLWLIGIPLASVLMPMLFFQTFPSDNFADYFNQFIANLIFTSIFWHTNRFVVSYFRTKLPEYNQYVKRLSYQLLIIYSFTIVVCFLSDSLFEFFLQAIIPEITKPSLGEIIIASLITTTIVLAIYESIYAVNMWKNAILETEQLKKENVKSQLETLKNQVNPHFLFNSLNTLASIIPDNPALSVEFVEKLSKVYRHILDIKDKEIVSINEELNAVEAYVFLLKTRFGKNLHIHFYLNKMDKYIIPLSLQMLIENAIKHNIVSASKPLTIEITEKEDSLVVTNNLQLKSNVLDSTKTGLDNISKRYRLLVDKNVAINQNETNFTVVLPLIKIEL